MTGTTLIIDPTAASHHESKPMRQTLATLAGKTVGFIDNSKPNFNYLAEDLGALLVSKYGVRATVTRRKRAASVPAGEVVMKELTEQCDLVITGSGD